jgi:hypothetical protein
MLDQSAQAIPSSTRMLIRAIQAQAGLACADDTWSSISDITLDPVSPS